jgi:hypothetical protein
MRLHGSCKHLLLCAGRLFPIDLFEQLSVASRWGPQLHRIRVVLCGLIMSVKEPHLGTFAHIIVHEFGGGALERSGPACRLHMR